MIRGALTLAFVVLFLFAAYVLMVVGSVIGWVIR